MADVSEETLQQWLPYRQGKDESAMRLWCFHWFGASASAYGTWEWNLSEDVELCAVQLPGREERVGQQPFSSAKEAAAAIVQHLRPMFEDKPYALFGHSSGCWIAYEVAILLRQADVPAPSILIVSDFPAPQTPVDLRPWKPTTGMSEREFQEEIVGWGLPRTLFERNQWELFENILRDEFRQFDEYEFDGDEEPLTCPVSAFLSQKDPKVGPETGNPELMEGWAGLSTHLHMTVDVFFGDHFYLQDSIIHKEVAKTIGERTAKIADLLTFDF